MRLIRRLQLCCISYCMHSGDTDLLLLLLLLFLLLLLVLLLLADTHFRLHFYINCPLSPYGFCHLYHGTHAGISDERIPEYWHTLLSLHNVKPVFPEWKKYERDEVPFPTCQASFIWSTPPKCTMQSPMLCFSKKHTFNLLWCCSILWPSKINRKLASHLVSTTFLFRLKMFPIIGT